VAIASGKRLLLPGDTITPNNLTMPTPALTLPQVRYGLSLLLLEVYGTLGTDYICRQVYRQLLRNELARFYHHCTRKCMPLRKLRRDIQ
jgi:hypothetical protein